MKRICVAAVPLLALAAGVESRFARAAERPNVLWIISEDMGPELGCYGTPEVWTPNLDKMAKQGVRYSRAFTTAPVCSASRSAFMTGMYQTTIGAHNHRSHRKDGYRLPEGVRLLTEWLREAAGKIDWNLTPETKPYDTADWTDLKSHQPFYAQINFSESHRGFSAPKRANPDKVKIPPYYPNHPITRNDWAGYLDEITECDRKVGQVLNSFCCGKLRW